MDNDSIQSTARAYHGAGLNVIPIDRNGSRKTPLCSWRQYQSKVQTDEDLARLFPDEQRNIGIVGGQVSRNFAVLDFDNKTSFRQLVEHSGTLQRLVSSTPVVRTGRGVHVYVRTPEPVRSTKNKDLSLDVKASGGYVVAPPSIHATGQLYLFEHGFKNIIELRALNDLPFVNLEPVDYRRRETFGLGRFFYVLFGKTYDYPSRSEAEYSLVLVAVKNGWKFDDIFELFRRFAGEKTKFREKAPRYWYGYLRSMYDSAVEYLTEERREFDIIVDNSRFYIDTFDFGRTRHTDRAVAHAVLDIARRSGKLAGLNLSAREVAEIAGVHRATAARSLKRIPFLHTIVGAIGADSETYNFENVTKRHTSTTPVVKGMSQYDINEVEPPVEHSHDVFRRGALGKTGYELVTFLHRHIGETFTVPEIANMVACSARTVIRKLDTLSKFGTVRKVARGRWILPGAMSRDDADYIARKLGTAGAGEKQKQEHDKERQLRRSAYEFWKRGRQENTA